SSGGWTHIAELTGASGTTTKRPFDIAYEQSSGDIMIVYSVNTATPVFRVAGAGGWTAETKVFSMGANDDVEWVRLEPNPGSDEIILVTQHADDEIWGQVWDGDAWGDAQRMEIDIEVTTAQCFDIAYENESGHGLVVWTDNAADTPQYRTWDGNNWSGEGSANSHGSVNMRWVKMAADAGSDSIIMATLDETDDVNVQVWDGSAWDDHKEVEGDAPTNSYRCFDVAYSSAGNEGIIVWSDDTTVPKYETWNGAVWSGEGSAEDVSNIPQWITLDADPFTDDFMLVTSSQAASAGKSKVDIQRWDGAAWGDLTALNNTGYKHESYAVSYDRYVPDSTPPAAISNLTAFTGTSEEGTITLKWTAPGDDGTGGGDANAYLVKFSSKYIGTGDFDAARVSTYTQSWTPVTAGNEEGTTGNRAISGLYPGVTFWFVIKTQDDSNNWSTWTSSGTDPGVNNMNWAVAYDTDPAVPSSLNAVALGSSVVNITWDANSEIDFKEYDLDYSSYSPSQGWQNLISTTSVSYTHGGLKGNNTYYYHIRAMDVWNNYSSWSSTAGAYTQDVVPSTPTSFNGTALSTHSIKWTWTDNAVNEYGFEIRTATGGVIASSNTLTAYPGTGTTSWIQLGLTANTSSYAKEIYAVNSVGYSASTSAAVFPVYTEAREPVNLDISDVYVSSVTLTWEKNDNPGHTRWGLSLSTDSSFSVAVNTFVVYSDGLTALTTAAYGLSPETTYWFRVWAYNGNGLDTGHIDASTQTLEYTMTMNVAINELAWGGTDAGSSDEWIELHNNTGFDIDMTGWKLYEQGGSVEICTLAGSIEANGYYLIERTDDTAVSDIAADLAVVFGGSGLTSTGEYLMLKDDAEQLVDEVNCGSGWFAGSGSPNYYSMERITSTVSGNISGNWDDNNGVIIHGEDADSNPLNGTPRNPNSVSTDNTLPAVVTNLTALTGYALGEITLKWTAPGDDGAIGDNPAGAYYTVKYATFSIADLSGDTTAWWNDSQTSAFTQSWEVSAVGTLEEHIVSGLTSGTTYFFAVKTTDEAGNPSNIDLRSENSNQDSAHASTNADSTSPGAITGLVAETGDSVYQVKLTWIAPGDDGYTGNNTAQAFYILKYATFSISDLSDDTTAWWSSANTYSQDWTVPSLGTQEIKVATMSVPGELYYFAIKTEDEAHRLSDIDDKSAGVTSQPAAEAKDFPRTVVINEIAWMGTSANTNHEWVELYNNTGSDINPTSDTWPDLPRHLQ
ncbi:lamin tail domain-containing protein, partial [Elusimicrobiota bacterium]